MLTIASIDVGIVNLALVVAEVDEIDLVVTRVLHLSVSDTTKFDHVRVPYETCTLGHMRTTTDRVNHFVQERLPLFQRANKVLIERQPIQGHTDVEQVLFMLFRDKAELVSPNAMHKYFNINHLSYEWRKVKTTEIADASFAHLHFPHYFQLQRRHDIADAWCLLLYWLQAQARAPPPHKTLPPVAVDTSTSRAEDADAPGATAMHDPEETDLEKSREETLSAFTQTMRKFVYKGRVTQK